jgi:eukaryotic-like serine/threonine-protein kinase
MNETRLDVLRPSLESTSDSACALDASTATPDVAGLGPAGRYLPKQLLSRGDSCCVHLASDSQLRRDVVVKMLHAGAGRARGRPIEEGLLAAARAAARLNHPNIVTVHDAGWCEQGVFITMEQLNGRDLRSRLADGWRPGPTEVARIARRIAEALNHAHGAGVLHGRVEPTNVFMMGRTHLKLLNVGLAPAGTGLEDTPLDRIERARKCQPAGYVAPERLLGETLHSRCDVYGLGLVMYEMLTGRAAFTGQTAIDTHRAVLQDDVPPVHTLNPAVPVTLSTIVACAMARNPALRYRSARHMLNAIRAYLSEADGSSRPTLRRDGRLRRAASILLVIAASGLGVLGLQSLPGQPPRSASVGTPAAQTALVAAPAHVQAAPTAPAVEPVVAVASAPTSEPAYAPYGVRELDPAVAASAVNSRVRQSAAAPAAVATSAKRPPPRAAGAAATHATTKAKPPAPPTRESAPERPPEFANSQRPSVNEVPAPTASAAAPTVATTAGRGAIDLVVAPWGQIEVNGMPVGTAPPMRRLTLPDGSYTITIRNQGHPAYSIGVNVSRDKPVVINHQFGSR